MLRRLSFKNSFRKSRSESVGSSKLAAGSPIRTVASSSVRATRVVGFMTRRRKSSTPSPPPTPPPEGDGDEYAEPWEMRASGMQGSTSAHQLTSTGTTNSQQVPQPQQSSDEYALPFLRQTVPASSSRHTVSKLEHSQSNAPPPLPAGGMDDYQDPFDVRNRQQQASASSNTAAMTATVTTTMSSNSLPASSCLSTTGGHDIDIAAGDKYCTPKDSLGNGDASWRPHFYTEFRRPAGPGSAPTDGMATSVDALHLHPAPKTSTSSATSGAGGLRSAGSPDSQHHDTASLGSSCSQHSLSGGTRSDSSLHSMPWFHGCITRDLAEAMLRHSVDSTFLVRVSESSPTDYSLSLRNSGQPLHLKIIRRSDGHYVLGQNSKPFASVIDMVRYYERHKLLIKGAEHIRLQFPMLQKAALG